MGLWIELGIFVLALAFGLWQIHDVKKARERSRQQGATARPDGRRQDQRAPEDKEDAGISGPR